MIPNYINILKYKKQIKIKLKGEINNSIIVLGDFNIPFSLKAKASRQEITL